MVSLAYPFTFSYHLAGRTQNGLTETFAKEKEREREDICLKFLYFSCLLHVISISEFLGEISIHHWQFKYQAHVSMYKFTGKTKRYPHGRLCSVRPVRNLH